MANTLQQWRKRKGLTQVDAATMLGVSQPYLSLLESGSRPLTQAIRRRMNDSRSSRRPESTDERFRTQLAALGYPGFAHLPTSRARPEPDALLLAVLSTSDADARVVDALPWLVRQFAAQMDFVWLVRQAKLQNIQNRLGFVLQAAAVKTHSVLSAVGELDRARLLVEATLCWDTMPEATRGWMRQNRSTEAVYWNILTMLRREGDSCVA